MVITYKGPGAKQAPKGANNKKKSSIFNRVLNYLATKLELGVKESNNLKGVNKRRVL